MFHIPFDVPTAYLVAGFLYVAMPITAWLVMGAGRSTAASIWCLGGISLGVGTLFLALRRDWPDWAIYALTNAFFYAGTLFHIAALRLELGEKPAWSINLLVFTVLMSGQEFVRLVLASPMLRFSWILMGISVMLGWTMWLAFRLYKHEDSVSARWLAYGHGAFVACGSCLGGYDLARPSHAHLGQCINDFRHVCHVGVWKRGDFGLVP
jgi:hypothetical protein